MTMYDLSKLPNLPTKTEPFFQESKRDKTYVAPKYNELDTYRIQKEIDNGIIKRIMKENEKKENFPQLRQGYKDR